MKLIVAGLIPLAAAALTLYLTRVINRAARRVEEVQWKNRKVIERLLGVYDEMAPLLNDVYCCFLRKGHFREVTPPDAVRLKRKLDQIFNVNRHLFGNDSDFVAKYEDFERTYFRLFAAQAKDAELRTDPFLQKSERGRSWKPKWKEYFAPEGERSSDAALERAYEDLMESFARELGVGR